MPARSRRAAHPLLIPLLLVTSITTGCLTAGRAAFSPDGQRVALRFVEDDRTGIAVHDLSSGRTRRILEPSSAADHVDAWWEKDGSTLATFSLVGSSVMKITRFDLTSGSTRIDEQKIPWSGEVGIFPLGPRMAAGGEASWIGPFYRKEAPEGQMMSAYLRLDPVSGKLETLEFETAVLFLEPPEDGALCVEFPRKPNDVDLKSPAALAEETGKPYLAKLTLPGGKLTRLKSLAMNENGLGCLPSLSPDGLRLASMPKGKEETSVTVRDREGTELYSIPLPERAEAGGPGTWHGNEVYFLGKSNDVASLYIAELPARKVRAISLKDRVDVREIGLIGPAVSPDGKRAAFPAYRQGQWGKDEDTRLVIVELDPVRTVAIEPEPSPSASPGATPGAGP